MNWMFNYFIVIQGVTLTREGEILYDYVKEAFEQLELGENVYAVKGRTYGSVRNRY